MGRKFKIGDHVCVSTCVPVYAGKVGKIIDIVNGGQYRVKLAGIINSEDPYGLFYFHETSLISQEAAEIHIMEEINRNISESIEEFNKLKTNTIARSDVWSRLSRQMVKPLVLSPNPNRRSPNITNVIFNNPATIVFWSDGSKTIVKCKDEAFDEEKGLAMAISKKVLGNKGNYFNEFKKWLPEIEEDYGPVPFDNMVECACEFGKVIGTMKGDK